MLTFSSVSVIYLTNVDPDVPALIPEVEKGHCFEVGWQFSIGQLTVSPTARAPATCPKTLMASSTDENWEREEEEKGDGGEGGTVMAVLDSVLMWSQHSLWWWWRTSGHLGIYLMKQTSNKEGMREVSHSLLQTVQLTNIQFSTHIPGLSFSVVWCFVYLSQHVSKKAGYLPWATVNLWTA